jgi:Pvc16 N-terminal domain
MIHQVLPAIVRELTEYLEAKFGISDDQVVLGNVVNQDGSLAIDGNKLVVSLINISRDGSLGSTKSFGGNDNPPVFVNLYVIFSAVYNQSNISGQDYLESLKMISGVISFFQGRNAFDGHTTPDFPADAHKIIAEIENIEFRELVNLWSLSGAKYVPSIVYRFRSLNMEEGLVTDIMPHVGTLSHGFNGLGAPTN